MAAQMNAGRTKLKFMVMTALLIMAPWMSTRAEAGDYRGESRVSKKQVSLALPKACKKNIFWNISKREQCNREVVQTALSALFTEKNQAAVDSFWSPNFIQHSPVLGDGLEPLRKLAGKVTYERVRILVEGDYVATHGRYTGLGEQPLIAFDIFRLEGGKIAEQWQNVQSEQVSRANSNTMLDGPTKSFWLKRSTINKGIIRAFVDEVLVQGKYDDMLRYFDGDNYIQHNPLAPDGAAAFQGLLKGAEAAGNKISMTKTHRLIGDGDFVLSQSEGMFGPTPFVYFDLFRLKRGKIVEHWDVMAPKASSLSHNNGQF